MSYKLGSLFDGSGGFPLAGSLCGIEPKWAAEVEPYPIAVTRSRFPSMKHLGDISKVNGAEIEPVDIITFGSPCQDLSVAGKRAGLKHEANGDEETTRSGLFMEAVRIIKEMRRATNGEYPRFALWENVPGAFSSNKGEDFRIVCEELIKIVEPAAVMPAVPKNGWPYADSYCGDGWSLAYRVFDAQYWGVPQRRRRIHLVADFRGERAREVLFEREGVRGYFAEGRTPWQAAARDAQDCTGADDRESKMGERGGDPGSDGSGGGRGLDAVGIVNAIGGNAENYQVSHHLPTLTNGSAPGFMNAVAYPDAVGFDVYNMAVTGEVAKTLKIRSGCEGGGKGALVQTDKSATLATNNDRYLFQPVPNLLLDDQGGQQINIRTDDKSPTLRAEAHGNVPVVAFRQGGFADYVEGEVGTLRAAGGDYGGGTENLLVERPGVRYIVRRLTPTECARLQGFADRWGDIDQKDAFSPEEFQFWHEVRNTHAVVIGGKEAKEYTEQQMLTWYNKLQTDSAEYKMWGNGIALPPALYVLQGMAEAFEHEEVEDDWML